LPFWWCRRSRFFFSTIGAKFGVKTNAYSYKTKYHKSGDKVEISDEDYEEGVKMIMIANKTLKRFGINKYMNLLARNWAQVKYSTHIYAVGAIISPGDKCSKGYVNKSKNEIVSGGTGYAVQLGIDNNKAVYVFDQNKDNWFRWSYTLLSFIKVEDVKIKTENFAGIGTREIKTNGIKAIQEIYNNTFK